MPHHSFPRRTTRRTTRREFLIDAAASTALAAAPLPAAAQTPPEIPSSIPSSWRDLVHSVTGGADPVLDKVRLDLPESVADGSSVVFIVNVESPMTPGDHVEAVHVITTGNRLPMAAAYFFSPANGAARALGFLRLSGNQDVAAIARTSGGRWFMGYRHVLVHTSRCAI